MAATRFLGLIFVLAIVFGRGRSESVIPEEGQDQVSASNENAFSVQIPLGNGNVIQTDTQVQPVQRRFSLEDFFMSSMKSDQQQQPEPPVQQQPVAQFQVQQPDPNSMLLVRDTQFPSSSGGLISRLLMLRRMLRIRRLARRLTIIPRLLGLGLRQGLQRSSLGSNSNPLLLFSNRVGEMYNPRDFVFGNKGFSYNNTAANAQQRNANADQLQQQTRGFPVEADPYYNGYNEGFNNQYDLENSNIKNTENFESQELNPLNNQDALNSLTNEQQLFLLQQLQTYQQQLNQLQEQMNKEPKNINLQTQVQANDHQSIQYQQPQQNIEHIRTNQYHQWQQNAQIQQNHQVSGQPELLSEQQLEQVRHLQTELLKEQLLQLQHEQQQLQQLQLKQQAQNNQIHNNQQLLQVPQNTHSEDAKAVGDRTEGYASPVGIGGSVGFGNAGNTVGVGINVGIKPPAVDILLTNPVAPEIKPFPPLVNPIAPKPLPTPPKVEPLVPLGIFPKPMLNLKGRVFFGAQMGKGVGVKSGVGR